jgi:hypothetical protein
MTMAPFSYHIMVVQNTAITSTIYLNYYCRATCGSDLLTGFFQEAYVTNRKHFVNKVNNH